MNGACRLNHEKHRAPGHILIVDDNEAHRITLQGILQSVGMLSDTCASDDAARERIIRNGISMVLVDVHLKPGANPLIPSGISLANWIRSQYPRLPVVLVTADKEIANQQLQWPVLIKAVEPRALVDCVKRVLQEKRFDAQDDMLEVILAKVEAITLPALIRPWLVDTLVLTALGALVAMFKWAMDLKGKQ